MLSGKSLMLTAYIRLYAQQPAGHHFKSAGRIRKRSKFILSYFPVSCSPGKSSQKEGDHRISHILPFHLLFYFLSFCHFAILLYAPNVALLRPPYSSWERPRNERHNRLCRKYLPKGVSIGNCSAEQIFMFADEMNDLSRKHLDYPLRPNSLTASLTRYTHSQNNRQLNDTNCSICNCNFRFKFNFYHSLNKISLFKNSISSARSSFSEHGFSSKRIIILFFLS